MEIDAGNFCDMVMAFWQSLVFSELAIKSYLSGKSQNVDINRKCLSHKIIVEFHKDVFLALFFFFLFFLLVRSFIYAALD